MAEQRVPVMAHVEFLVLFPRVAFIDRDELVMPGIC